LGLRDSEGIVADEPPAHRKRRDERGTALLWPMQFIAVFDRPGRPETSRLSGMGAQRAPIGMKIYFRECPRIF